MQESKYVLDVNVLINYIITQQTAKLVSILCNIEAYSCDELLAELQDVLNRPKIKKYLTQSAEYYLSIISSVLIHRKLTRKYTGSPDIKDDYLFALCLSTKATLVTGDKKLQNFKETPIPIISTTEFKKRYH